jgi:hypothetical protein
VIDQLRLLQLQKEKNEAKMKAVESRFSQQIHDSPTSSVVQSNNELLDLVSEEILAFTTNIRSIDSEVKGYESKLLEDMKSVAEQALDMLVASETDFEALKTLFPTAEFEKKETIDPYKQNVKMQERNKKIPPETIGYLFGSPSKRFPVSPQQTTAIEEDDLESTAVRLEEDGDERENDEDGKVNENDVEQEEQEEYEDNHNHLLDAYHTDHDQVDNSMNHDLNQRDEQDEELEEEEEEEDQFESHYPTAVHSRTAASTVVHPYKPNNMTSTTLNSNSNSNDVQDMIGIHDMTSDDDYETRVAKLSQYIQDENELNSPFKDQVDKVWIDDEDEEQLIDEVDDEDNDLDHSHEDDSLS